MIANAHFALSIVSLPGTPLNHSKARRWQANQVITSW
ncbi:hypothetical protein LEAN103870_16005 [Legionella anisa]